MANEKVHLTEKGYGSKLRGSASIIADESGQPMNLRLLVLPDGGIGGCATLLPAEAWAKEKVKSFMPESAWYLRLERNQNIGTVTVMHYIGIVQDKLLQTAFIYEKESVRFIASEAMEGAEEAKQLLNGILADAVDCALFRSYAPKPDKLYFGSVALDSSCMTLVRHKDKLAAMANKA